MRISPYRRRCVVHGVILLGWTGIHLEDFREVREREIQIVTDTGGGALSQCS